jgi:hypothetical protein
MNNIRAYAAKNSNHAPRKQKVHTAPRQIRCARQNRVISASQIKIKRPVENSMNKNPLLISYMLRKLHIFPWRTRNYMDLVAMQLRLARKASNNTFSAAANVGRI